MLLSHNNSFASEAFIFIGNVYLALFAMRFLKTLLEENKIVFSLNIVYFSVCLTSNKLYWIEDPTCRRLYSILYVGELVLASSTVGDLTVIRWIAGGQPPVSLIINLYRSSKTNPPKFSI